MNSSSKKNWKESTTIWGMLVVFIVCLAVSVAGTAYPQYVASPITEACTGGAVVALGAILLRLKSLSVGSRTVLPGDKQ
jgi:hypothetical protein